jgi:F-type H+-transporting ATPase subunit epsilon
MTTDLIHLVVQTPDKIVLDRTVESMRVLLPDGWWGILSGHAPLLSLLHAGIVYYQAESQKRYIALYEGTVEVRHRDKTATEVLILTSAAEEGEDLEAVQAVLDKQADRLEKLAKEANLEFNQLKLSLEKSLQEANISKMGL